MDRGRLNKRAKIYHHTQLAKDSKIETTYPLTDLLGAFHGAAEIAALGAGATSSGLQLIKLFHDLLFVSLKVRAALNEEMIVSIFSNEQMGWMRIKDAPSLPGRETGRVYRWPR